MRVYKFRGKTFDTGEYVYGDLIQGDNGVYIKRWEDGVEVEVDNDTIAQLVGLDKNGREVYEGDWVKTPFKEEPVQVSMTSIYTVHEYELVAA